MSHSKQDYEALAKILGDVSLARPAWERLTILEIAGEIAAYFERTNPAFSRGRFMKAVREHGREHGH